MDTRKNDPSTNGRDGKGKFVPGNRCGHGNPFGGQTAKLRAAMVHAVTPEDMAEIIRRVVANAKEGDLASAKTVFAYCVGQPHQEVASDTTDLDAMVIAKKRIHAKGNLDFAELMNR